ncbi:hypothetical protein F5I97DRAFT_1936213 [Phlebopus sp. FC_14]|nr:hypothetical protein F5I97DRAFT_1936213 [Phlebopus sp. FC_14]
MTWTLMLSAVAKSILFTNDFPHADIHKLLALDILHQLIKGAFKDYLINWVEHYLKQVYIVAPFTGLQHFSQGHGFKQWTSDNLKALMKITFWAFLNFCYLVQRNIITEHTLTQIQDALGCFHYYWTIFNMLGALKALGQMLLTNQRLDKLSAAYTDFCRCGMLQEICLLEANEADNS